MTADSSQPDVLLPEALLPDTLLQVQGIDLSIHGTPILSDVSFALSAGKTLGLIGESGSGKSMTALSVMQLLPAGSHLQGSVWFDGQDLLQLSEQAMCDLRGNEIGMIFQEPMTALNPVSNIGTQVAETIRVHGNVSRRAALQQAELTLDRVGLPSKDFPLSRFPHQLSGGQRQRVVIAMAIALKPKLLIADEPTTALDVTTQAQILTLLKNLVDEDGMGLLLITHDLAVVAQASDSIVIMKSGEIVESGSTSSVFRELQHPYTRQLFQASTYMPQRIAPDKPVVTDASPQQTGTLQAQPVPLLKVEGLVRDYVVRRGSWFGGSKTFRAVDRVSFTIDRGESVGLVGESGCGKSTLTRAILGLEPIQAGSIDIDGDSVVAGTAMSRELRRKMQVVFQDPYGSFNPRHRVRRLLAEPFHLLDDAPVGQQRDEIIAEVLASVGLDESDGRKYIHEFSGGQRQRIAIARALIIKPALIVLDEAVSALDVSIRAQILDLLEQLKSKYHLAYLFISHDLSVVRGVTDRVLVMKAGAIVEAGDTATVFHTPQHEYTRSLIEAIPTLPESISTPNRSVNEVDYEVDYDATYDAAGKINNNSPLKPDRLGL